uniref:inactive tyrosine-protein kinase transmembrane receptor ROR1-like n=1 Tax=Styela clava TaxID=7725 RepID=UPI00193A3957|nr:inactive tyrosine-protein kinase transmembrane receptor ROR1-like [Styela clava]
MRSSYNMRERLLIFVLFVWTGKSDSTISAPVQPPIEVPLKELSAQGTNFAASESNGKNGRQSDADTGHYFRVVSDMHNQSLVSGGKAQFRCKVEGYPMDDVTFTWYKGNTVIDPSDDPRISIRQKSGISRLQISDVFTADSGLYRCESSNGFRRVATQAHLSVSFIRPPPPGKDETIEPIIPAGKCEPYQGLACATFLAGRHVYIDPYQNQMDMEKSMSLALSRIADPDLVSQTCQRHAIPALCYFVFPVCDNGDEVLRAIRGKQTAEEKATKLCREDCELLMNDVCKNEFKNPDDDVFMEQIAATANCSQLPPTTARGSECMKVGLKSVVEKQHTCYNGTGYEYKGVQRKTISGITCKSWPLDLVQKHTELSGGHNFCRNPGHLEQQPWCFIDEARKTRELCDISKCAIPSSGSELITILIPSVAIPLLIACIGAVFYFCCRNKRSKGIPGKQVKNSSMPGVELSLATTKNLTKVPHLNPQSLHFTMDLGDGQFGKVYKAQLAQNMNFNSNFPVAVKTLNEGASKYQVEEFQREMEIFSELQHPNVACLKAVVVQPNRRCMVFEYTNRVDLHEFLSLHSPHSDVGVSTKMSSSASSQASSSLEPNDFIMMMSQIASGMDYLASRNFVHRDLSARNILVCQNNILKICNLGVVRDCYLSSYYRSPQGGNMLPIRWMAPESLTNNNFSTKSTVWSFGVLVWEMFSYGLQPYCGYSNQEVLDMITRFQLLSCPDQCPARVYTLMHECWAQDPNCRPSFKDIHAKLCGWEGANATRMTSQLARGIHRQLTNIMKEGQYGQYSSMETASIPSYNTPSPPPTYNAVTGFANISQQYSQPAAPNVSPASQNVFSQSSPATSTSAPVYQGQGLVVDLQGSQDPTQLSHSFTPAGFMNNESQNFQPRYYADQPQYGNSRRPTQSSRSTSSCASSCSEYGPMTRSNPAALMVYNQPQQQSFQYGVPQPQQKFYGGIDYPVTSQAYQPQPGYMQQHRRPLSGVIEDDNGVDNLNHSRLQPPSAAVAPYSVSGTNSDGDNSVFSAQRSVNMNTSAVTDSSRISDIKSNNNDVKPTVSSTKIQNEETESSTSSTSAAAPSCDSGLPVDEESDLIVSNANHSTNITSPLIAPKPYTPKNQSARSTPNKGKSDRNFIA